MSAPILNTILRALLRWWWLIVLSVSLGVGVGYLLRTEQPDLYRAEATVIIGQNTESSAPVAVSWEVLSAYTVLVRRNTLLQPVIDDLGLNISINELLNNIAVSTVPNAALLSIAVTDNEPDRAAAIANQIVDELIRQTSDRNTLLDLQFINAQVENLQQQITSLQQQQNDLIAEAENLTSAFELTQNVQERAAIDQAIQDLRQTLLTLLANAPASDIQLFDAAVPNYFPITTNSPIDLVIAGFAGGILSFLMIILFTFFDDRLQWDENKEEYLLGLKVLGPMGIVPKHKLPLYVDTMPQSVETEALRQLRAKIALAAGGTFPRVITVVSHDSGEGKTLTSANLALESANSGLRTLVIDADMRRGDLHEIFQLPNINGLSDLLHSNKPLGDLLPHVLLDSGYENLTIMPCGRSESDPAALLGRSRLTDLIDLLVARYDSIIIDSAPTIGGPDAVFLGGASDGMIIVVNTRHTRLSSLKRSIEELRVGSNVNLMGVVFNRVRLQITSKYNNNYYRQTPALAADKLNKEMTRSGSGLFGLRRHIITDRNGERLYSTTACATRMGVRRRTIQSWIDSGYLKAERRFFRRWIRESAISAILEERLKAVSPAPQNGSSAQAVAPAQGIHNHVPETLREQREAILDFLNQPPRTDPDN